jgi:hypothetical protein
LLGQQRAHLIFAQLFDFVKISSFGCFYEIMGFGQQRVVSLGGRRWRGCRRATAAHCFDRLRVWRPLRSRSWASHMSVVSTVIQERALAPSFTHPRQQPQQGQPEQPEQHQHQHQRQQGQSEQQEEVHAQRACDGRSLEANGWLQQQDATTIPDFRIIFHQHTVLYSYQKPV